MDRVELRNLLLKKQLTPCVLDPMRYNPKTFEAICDVVEGAFLYEQKKGNVKLIKAVRRLKRLKGGKEDHDTQL